MIADLAEGLSESSGTCKKHGTFSAMVLPFMKNAQPQCPTCVVEDAANQSRQSDSKDHSERYRRQRIERIGAPPRLLKQSFDSYAPQNETAKGYLAVCKAFAENWGRVSSAGANLTLIGKTGTGKSHLAVAICQVVASTGAQPIYTTASGLIRHIRGSYATNATYTEPQAFEKFSACDLLVLDELGAKASSEHDRATIFEVIDVRNQNELPTIVISNLNMEEIEEQTDARTVDRLSQNGTTMDFDWESYRTKA